jgi:hypothetical protein
MVSFESGAAAAASAIIGVALFGYGLYLRSTLRSCQRWPQTTGTVTQAGLDTDDGIRLSVIYAYTVNGAGYSSSRIQFGTPTTYIRRSSADAAVSQYPVGSQVTVYYDPENPAEAVLDRTSPGGLEYIIFGIIMLVMMVLILMYPSHDNAARKTKGPREFQIGMIWAPGSRRLRSSGSLVTMGSRRSLARITTEASTISRELAAPQSSPQEHAFVTAIQGDQRAGIQHYARRGASARSAHFMSLAVGSPYCSIRSRSRARRDSPLLCSARTRAI